MDVFMTSADEKYGPITTLRANNRMTKHIPWSAFKLSDWDWHSITHPGEVVNHDDDGNPITLPKCRTPEEIKEARNQQEQAKKKSERNTQNAIAVVGLVEDSLREEDIARQTRPNRQLENVPSFQPPITIKKGRDSLKTPENEHQDQIDGASFESFFLPCCYWHFIYQTSIIANQKKQFRFFNRRSREETTRVCMPWRKKNIISIKV